jgi:transposase, IS5 family
MLIVQQMTSFSYSALAFHLGDSTSYRTFCRLGLGVRPPSISALKRDLKRVTPETLEKIHWVLLEHARNAGVETGR